MSAFTTHTHERESSLDASDCHLDDAWDVPEDGRCRLGDGQQHSGVLYMHVEPVDELKGAVESSWETKLDDDAVKCVAEGEGEERQGEEEQGDWRNVEKLSDLFSLMESEQELGADFGVFIEDQDAIHVEEISDIFSALEDANRSSSELEIVLQGEAAVESPADVEDARAVDEFADLFSSLEAAEDAADAENVDAMSELFSQLEEQDEASAADAENVDAMSELFTELEEQEAADSADAENVDAMSELFTELEEQDEASAADAENVDAMSALFTDLEGAETGSEPTKPRSGSDQDWIDSLEVDNVSSLFAELEEAVESPPPKADTKVDSRIFVPTFAVRIEGKPATGPAQSLLSVSSTMLVGPPRSAPRHCPPPVQSRADSVGRWREKRKTRSFAARPADPSISDTRRACAAKRQRVKGRFVAEKHSFVSITSLQQS